MQKIWLNAASFLLLLAPVLTGCGTGSTASVGCFTGNLSSSTSGSPQFTLAPVNAELTIYPGQTEQFPVTIQSVNGSTGTVTLNMLPGVEGLTIAAPVTGAIGSTVNLTISATPNVVASCFTGQATVFTAGRAMTLQATSGSSSVTNQYAVNIVLENPSFVPSTVNLPVLSITTTDAAPIDSEDTYVDGTLTITDAAQPTYNYTGASEFKGHGHSTWTEPKKPYRVNLTTKAPLLGMASDSNWILLANYDDKTMLRNDVAFEISKIFDMAWTPSSVFTELYLNGQYEGTYELTEKVEVSKARLNIGSIDDTDNSGTDLTGGYLGEIDHYDGETFMTTSPIAGLPIGIDDPSTPTTTQSQYFTSVFDPAEVSLYASGFTDPNTGWRASWDQTSTVNYFLIEELAGNQDADDWSSDYFYKPRSDARFYRGPVWDFDVSMGNDNYGAIESPSVPWVSTQAAWYVQLFKDPTFAAAVKAQWQAIRPQFNNLITYITTRASQLALTANNNNGRWPTMGEDLWPSPKSAGSYAGEVANLQAWLTARLAYMDATYGSN